MIDFFVLGNPRSGTTLLRLMLTAHPAIVVPPEAGFAVWLMQHLPQQGFSVRRFVEAVAKTKKIESWCLDYVALERFLGDHRVDNKIDAIKAVYRFYVDTCKPSARLIGDKNNFYIHHIDVLSRVSPTAKFIHIVRDGRDVACSYRGLMAKRIVSDYAPRLAVDIAEIATEWRDNNAEIIAALAHRQSLRIRLEQLVSEPRRVLEQVCHFLDVGFDAAMLSYYQDSNESFFEPREFDQWKAKNRQPLVNENYKYRTELSASEITEFNCIAGDMLLRLGYSLSEVSKPSVNSASGHE